MLPGERPSGADDQRLAFFLREHSRQISRLATRILLARLGVAGRGIRRRIRQSYEEQLETAARLLDLYGEDAPSIYGEHHRRLAATRLTQGMQLGEAIEEVAIVAQAVMDVWEKEVGDIPPPIARRIVQLFALSAAQISDVYLVFQRAESAAFREAALLQTLVGHINEAILLIERDGTVSYVSPVFEKITGQPGQLFVGETIYGEEGAFARMEVRDRFGNRIAPEEFPARIALEKREPQHADALFWRRADGTDAVLEVDCAPVFDEAHRLRGVVVTLRDRTTSYHRQRELEAAYRELRKMHARLLGRTRLEAVGGLAQSAAHALNNQLNVIALRLEQLKEFDEAHDVAEGIERAVREITAIVSRLQELASAPERRAPTPTDVNAAIGDAIALTRSELESAHIPVLLDLKELPPAMGDRETLLEFFATILLGATDVFPEGGAIRVSSRAEGSEVVVRVAYEGGVTLSEQDVESLFEPLAGEVAGRTLSLAAGQNAILRWGGQVRVEAREGGGNVFEIRLPRVPDEGIGPRVERIPPAPRPARPAESVLVVDDDPDNAEMLAALIEDAGKRAYTALSGEDGIELARKLRPDAALVDLLLPDRDGWEVARELKALAPWTRVAVVSGLAVGKGERREGVADEVFRKPVDPNDVLRFLGLEA